MSSTESLDATGQVFSIVCLACGARKEFDSPMAHNEWTFIVPPAGAHACFFITNFKTEINADAVVVAPNTEEMVYREKLR